VTGTAEIQHIEADAARLSRLIARVSSELPALKKLKSR
jgi:hypothetical protein